MTLHPGVLALLTGCTAALFLLAVGSLHAVRILRGWDFGSSSEDQLDLERSTVLVSTAAAVALGFEAASVFLFVYTVDDVHTLFTGAMCATGSLNANPVGWWALALKLVLLFSGGLWLVVNGLDTQAEAAPLVRPKFGALLVLLPLVAADLGLQGSYFLGLRTGAITSCCGSLFEGGGSVASVVGSFPARPMLWVFYASSAALLGLGWRAHRTRQGRAAAAYSLFCVFFLPTALASIVSFVSTYLYELPTHHCPFDFLQADYGYIGYPLYATLFLGCFFGVLPGLLAPLGRRGLPAQLCQTSARRWLQRSLGFTLSFVLLVTGIVVRSHYRLGAF